MKILLKIGVIAMCMVSLPNYAEENKTTRESVEELISISSSQEMLDDIYNQVEPMLQQMIEASGEQQSGEISKKLTGLFKQEFSMEKMKEPMTKVYMEIFTPAEISAILTFYKTPEGQSMIKKTPLLMQKIGEIQSQAVIKIMPKLGEIIKGAQK